MVNMMTAANLSSPLSNLAVLQRILLGCLMVEHCPGLVQKVLCQQQDADGT